MAGDKCAGAVTGCELCGGAAAVHCAADSAFLCARCDAKVHGANFLASRHVRRRLVLVDDDGHWQSEHGSATDSDASSSCVSTADSCCAAAPRAVIKGRKMVRKSKKERARAEEVLEGWAKRMGLARGAARRRAARAARALRALGRSRVPLRVAMAAALWSEVAGAGCGGEAALLRRLEASAHVPARMVVAVAAWMARAAGRAAAPLEEGWAECS